MLSSADETVDSQAGDVTTGGITVGDVAHALNCRFPASWAEEWDNVGLITGDSLAPATGVLVTLDATAEAVARAAEAGANVLVTHHPPFLEPSRSRAAAPGPAGTLEAAMRLGVAVISLHTNLDRSPEGAAEMAHLLGMDIVSSLEESPEPVAMLVTYAPPGAVDGLRHAMAAAGAGRIGPYEECAFVSPGTGRFSPMAGAMPLLGDDGEGVAEVRLEMVAPVEAASRVLRAARDAHPYEEPVVLCVNATRARGLVRMGRVCTWRDGATLAELAAHVAHTLGAPCRIWGDPCRLAGRVAVGNGSVGSLVSDAMSAADTLVGGEVRYHDALAAAASGLAIIEAGHDVTEWPLVRVVQRSLREWDPELPVVAETPSRGWWTVEAPNVGR